MKHLILPLILFLAIFAGCKTKSKLQTQTLPEDNTVLQDTTEMALDNAVLMYPAQALYVIGREYEELADSTSAKSNSAHGQKIITQNLSLSQYMEMRLLELYPQKAFQGIMADFDLGKLSRHLPGNNQNVTFGATELASISPSLGMAQAEPFYQFVSLEDEVNFLNMSPRELDKYLTLNKLASNEKFATLADFEKIKDSIPPDIPDNDKIFMTEENIYLSYLLFATGGGYLVYRVLVSKERAMSKAQYYYGSATDCGQPGDAYKHLLVNVLLRRYLSESAARLVMDDFWENYEINCPCDRQMDLHNNHVGRNTQYNHFRGDFWKDRYDWEKWSVNIHNFVENKPNNAIEKQWNKSMLEYILIKELKAVSKNKYVFWNSTSDCESDPRKK